RRDHARLRRRAARRGARPGPGRPSRRSLRLPAVRAHHAELLRSLRRPELMPSSWDIRAQGRALLADEPGTIFKERAARVALVYPSPYRAAMSSLGYQAIYRALNETPGFAADRAMLPEPNVVDGPLLTLESERPIGEYPLVAFSVAYELEIPGLLTCLERARLPPPAEARDQRPPIAPPGGPLTFSNPVPPAPFCDVIAMGEAETLAVELAEAVTGATDKTALLAELASRPGYYVP